MSRAQLPTVPSCSKQGIHPGDDRGGFGWGQVRPQLITWDRTPAGAKAALRAPLVSLPAHPSSSSGASGKGQELSVSYRPQLI